jgi:Tfp pilus assembly protein PilE
LNTLNNKRGDGIIEFIVIIAVISIIAVNVISDLQDAIENRQQQTLQHYNGNDTITEFE